MTTTPTRAVRPLEAGDAPEWRALWTDYLAFYDTSVADAVFETTFARLLDDDPRSHRGLVALEDGKAVGIAHYLFHRHAWRIDEVCYLQDLFVAPTSRGGGTGRALIEAVYAAADAHGAGQVYWLTREGNAPARRLYDRVARVTDFIRYQRS